MRSFIILDQVFNIPIGYRTLRFKQFFVSVDDAMFSYGAINPRSIPTLYTLLQIAYPCTNEPYTYIQFISDDEYYPDTTFDIPGLARIMESIDNKFTFSVVLHLLYEIIFKASVTLDLLVPVIFILYIASIYNTFLDS